MLIRGYTPEALKLFCERVGEIEIDRLRFLACSRELNQTMEALDCAEFDQIIDFLRLQESAKLTITSTCRFWRTVLGRCAMTLCCSPALLPKLIPSVCWQTLEETASRAFAVLQPIKVTITNWPEGKVNLCSF